MAYFPEISACARCREIVGCAMSDYYIRTYKCQVSVSQARRIDREIKKIDSGADFVRHYAAGNDIHGWLVRDNDGRNYENEVRCQHKKMIEIADRILGVCK